MLEDSVWDEFGESDDHIVPHNDDEHKSLPAIQGESCKKRRQELHGIRSKDNVSSYGTWDKKESCLTTLNQKQKLLEKGSWSPISEGVFPSCDSDSCNEVKILPSDDPRMSDHCFKSSNIDSSGNELCADDTILGDKCVVEDESMCQYPINHISQTDNELSFLDNDGWLDIGNFEDVDRMFRSCDSTFGMGSLNNEEEFCWLSSSHGTEGSDDAMKSDFNFLCTDPSPLKNISDYNINSKANIEGPSINDFKSNNTAFPIDRESRSFDDGDAIHGSLSMFSELDMKPGNTDGLMTKEKRKLSRPLDGRRRNDYLENGDSLYPCAPLKQFGDVKQLNGTSSSGVTSHTSIQKHESNKDSDSLGSIQTHILLSHPDYSHAKNHTSLLPTLSGSRSELDGHPSPSLKGSSYASNVESCHGHSMEAASLKANEKREKLYHFRDAQTSSRAFKNEKMSRSMPFNSPGPTQQQVHQFENENEGHSEVGGASIGFSLEIDSSNAQESSSMSSALDEISLEATSFRQLQQVMDQLDIRTKLCIRDSLYRLSKSAEQRHNFATTEGSIGDEVEACKAIMAQDTSRIILKHVESMEYDINNGEQELIEQYSGCTGLMDMETDTNPIDRSIAHLLFHRPSDQSMLPLNDAAPFKTNAMIHGSVTNPPGMTENQICQEEASRSGTKAFGGNT